MQRQDTLTAPTIVSATLLEEQYYSPISETCDEVTRCIALLHGGDVHQTATRFTSLASKLTDQLATYIGHARYSLLPYLLELIGKQAAGHDCRSCSGTCKMQHPQQLAFLRIAHHEISSTLDELKLIGISENEKTTHPQRLQLCKLIRLLDGCIYKLFALDDTLIIPTITDAQNHMHANQ